MIINPTGGEIRMDSMGSGRYGSSRGDRKHLGLDLMGMPGQWVVAPEDGIVTGTGKPYGDNGPWDVYIRMEGDSGLWRFFYTKPIQDIIGMEVLQYQAIGKLQDVSEKYGDDMIPHLHLELIDKSVKLDPTGMIEGLA